MSAPVKGLGLIVRQPSMPAIAIAVGLPFSGLGVLGTWHTFGAMSRARSAWANLGLAVGGVLSVGLVVEGAVLAVAGLIELFSPAPAPRAPSSQEMVGTRRLRGIGQINQPELLVGQDHWLDRQWPDRYSEWWTGPAPRL